ncbi:hypothetical protein ACSQ8M_01170 [Marinovum sp. B10]
MFALGADGFCDDCYALEREKRKSERQAHDEFQELNSQTGDQADFSASNGVWPMNLVKWSGYTMFIALPLIGMTLAGSAPFLPFIAAALGCGVLGAFFDALVRIVNALSDIRTQLSDRK